MTAEGFRGRVVARPCVGVVRALGTHERWRAAAGCAGVQVCTSGSNSAHVSRVHPHLSARALPHHDLPRHLDVLGLGPTAVDASDQQAQRLAGQRLHVGSDGGQGR